MAITYISIITLNVHIKCSNKKTQTSRMYTKRRQTKTDIYMLSTGDPLQI